MRVETAVPVPAEGGEDLGDGHTAGQQRCRVAVGGEEPVVRGQSGGGPHLGGFLSCRGGVGREPTLPGQVRDLCFEPADEDHLPVETGEGGIAGDPQPFGRSVGEPAICADEADRLQLGQ